MTNDALSTWNQLYAGFQKTSQAAIDARAKVTAGLHRKIAGSDGPTQGQIDEAERLERMRSMAAIGLNQFVRETLKDRHHVTPG